ncbi:MAG: hypothetical protein V4481_05145 [Patescibacteria group bacterium]
MKTYYAPTFIDESRTLPNRQGNSKPTGNLRGMVFTRTFYKTKTGKITSKRGIIPFKWVEDTEESKAEALENALIGLEEMRELDANPPLTFVPDILKNNLTP